MTTLPKHIDQMEDDELLRWIQRHVEDDSDESLFLEYKETLEVSKPSQKKEFAKDVSSFANAWGGELIYGVTDGKQETVLASGERVKRRKLVGIDPFDEMRSRLDQILCSNITPPLIGYRIRPVKLQDGTGKVALVISVPQSWIGPHMVTAGKDYRYYKRAEARSIPVAFESVAMAEPEIRELYERNKRASARAEEFIRQQLEDLSDDLSSLRIRLADSIESKQDGIFYCLIVPLLLQDGRIDTSDKELRSWLVSQKNMPYASYGHPPKPLTRFVPSLHGLQLKPAPGLEDYNVFREQLFLPNICEIYRNGALEYARVLSVGWVVGGVIILERLVRLLWFGRNLYQYAGYYAPLKILVAIENVRHLAFLLGYPDDYVTEVQYPGFRFQFSVDATGADLIMRPQCLAIELMQRFYSAFGLEFRDNLQSETREAFRTLLEEKPQFLLHHYYHKGRNGQLWQRPRLLRQADVEER